jgi:AcrR family transcriptional regulator
MPTRVAATKQGPKSRRAATRSNRREPRQLRARRTVEAVLDAVTRVLKREGIAGVTTNRIAKVAGVSIGSVYQYFPNKQAIFVALRERHVDNMASLVETRLTENATAPLRDLIRGLMEAMIEAHAVDPALFDLLLRQLPSGPKEEGNFEARLEGALRLALSARSNELAQPLQFDRILFVLTQTMEALAHGVVLRRPSSLSMREAQEEAVKAVLAYLNEHTRAASPRRVRVSQQRGRR